MKNTIIILFFALLIISCGNTKEGEQKTGLISNLVSITDNEDKGIKEVLNFYGGKCEYLIGKSASTSEGKKSYFTLRMSESEIIEKLTNVIEMPASNIAYLFYKNLKEEKPNYDEIRVEIIFSDGEKMEFKYLVSKLELVKNKMNLPLKITNLLEQKKFSELSTLIDESVFEFDKKELIENLTKVEGQLGNIIEDKFRTYGFRIYNKENKELIHISGYIVRDKQSNEFSIDTDLNSDSSKVYLLQYKL